MPDRRPCKLCGQTILWVRLASGKAMPVNQHPDPDTGTVAVYRDVNGRTIGRVVSEREPVEPHERLHVTHFATCTVHLEREAERLRVKRANRAIPNVINLADRQPNIVTPGEGTRRTRTRRQRGHGAGTRGT
jgi:hypothetical protein